MEDIYWTIVNNTQIKTIFGGTLGECECECELNFSKIIKKEQWGPNDEIYAYSNQNGLIYPEGSLWEPHQIWNNNNGYEILTYEQVLLRINELKPNTLIKSITYMPDRTFKTFSQAIRAMNDDQISKDTLVAFELHRDYIKEQSSTIKIMRCIAQDTIRPKWLVEWIKERRPQIQSQSQC